MAARVYRGYDEERRSFEEGDTIRIRRPSTFTAQNAPSSAQDLNTGSVTLTLNQWKEVKFKISDKDLAYTGERIISEHIAPMAYALADNIDQTLAAQYTTFPWLYDYGTAVDHTIITGGRTVAFNNRVPMDNMLHLMVDGTVEAYFLNSTVFHSAQVAGPGNSEAALMRGSLGVRFGIECFSNQNTPTHTPGTAVSGSGDNAGAVNNVGGYAVGATSMAIDGLAATAETFLIGDTFSIAGNTQKYALTANATVSGNAITATFRPGLVAAAADDAVVTFEKQTATAHSQLLLFHEHAMAIAMAPLPENLPGIEVFTATDPQSGLAVRARRWSDGANSDMYMALDVLYGVATLNENLAVRLWT